MSNICGFVDEYGTPSLNLEAENITVFYIISVIIVDDSDKYLLNEELEKISFKFFSGSEIKSSNVSKNHSRRISILEDLAKLNFSLSILAIDKREVNRNSGLIYNSPFLKFLHKQLYEKITFIHPSIDIKADEIKNREFMSGFIKYLDNQIQTDLFIVPNFEFENSKSNRIIQLADFYAGSLARVVDPKKLPNDDSIKNEIFDLIKMKSNSIEIWPIHLSKENTNSSNKNSESHDLVIKNFAIKSTLKFINSENEYSDEWFEIKRETLKYFLFHQQYNISRNFISTDEIINYLNSQKLHSINKENFRLKVIGPLRTKGLLISSSFSGYKIPFTLEDVSEYIKISKNIIMPMLDRITKARETIKTLTLNKLDILESTEFSEIKKLIEGYKDNKIMKIG